MVEEQKEPAAAARSPSRTSARRSFRARAAFGLLGCGFLAMCRVVLAAGLCISYKCFDLYFVYVPLQFMACCRLFPFSMRVSQNPTHPTSNLHVRDFACFVCVVNSEGESASSRRELKCKHASRDMNRSCRPSPQDPPAHTTLRRPPGRRTMKETCPSVLYTPHSVLRHTIDPGIFLRLARAPANACPRLSPSLLHRLSVCCSLSLSSPAFRFPTVNVQLQHARRQLTRKSVRILNARYVSS